jgi:metal-dependent hydrolase (beta-lactamase superfamily II)
LTGLKSFFRIACVPGDDAGPEAMEAALKVLENAVSYFPEVNLEFVKIDLGFNRYQRTKETVKAFGTKFGGICEETINTIENTDAMLYTAVAGARFQPLGLRTPYAYLRRHFNTFAEIRPYKSYPNGLPKDKNEYELLGAEFILRHEKMEIAEKMSLVGPIARVKPSDHLFMPNRCLKEGLTFKPDPFTDEQILVINTPKGVLLILGCTHNGLENTVNQVREIMHEERIYGIVGGLHLCDTSIPKLKDLALWLKKLGVEVLVCGHCTSFEAAAIFYQILGDKVVFNYVGKKTTVEL